NGARGGPPRSAVQPAGPYHRRPLHLFPRVRRRPDGGRLARGLLARRSSEARPTDRDLRRQPHHYRREDRSHVLGRYGQAVRELRLARGARGGRQRPRCARRGARRGPARRGPAVAAELERRLAGRLADGWDEALPTFAPGEAQATRVASGRVLNVIAPKLPELIGGSADLANSTNVVFKNGGDVAAGTWGARNV